MAEQSKNAPLNWPESLVALLLAGVGGSVDAIGYSMFAGLFMGFMSGNTTLLGLNLGQQHWDKAGQFAFTIGLFVLGAFVGALLPDQKMVRALALEAVLLAVALGWQVWGGFSPATTDPTYVFPRVALLAAAMGIQSGTLQRVGTQSIHTTFVTGNLTSLAALLAAPFTKPSAPPPAGPAARPANEERRGLLAGVWLVYVLGAAAGALTSGFHARGALLLPLLLLIAALGLSTRLPGKPNVRDQN